MKKTLLLGFAVSLLAVPALVLAGPIVRTGDSVTVGADQLLEGDFYGAGGTVIVSGEAEGDVYVVGGSVTINAPVAADVTAAGGSVQIHGDVADDVRVAGGEVTIAGHVGGDVLVFGGTLHVLSTATIDGDILFFAGTADIAGDVGGSVVGKAELVTLNAGVAGDVSLASTGRLTLGERTEIQGSLEYTSAVDIARSPDAVVVGEITQEPMRAEAEGSILARVIPLFTLLFATLAAYLFMKSRMQELAERVRTAFGKYGLIGLGVLFGAPFIGLLLMVSVLGTLAGLALMFGFALLVVTAVIVLPAVLGAFVLLPFTKILQVTPVAAVVGTIVLGVLMVIPFVGPLCAFAAFVVALGGVSIRVYKLIK